MQAWVERIVRHVQEVIKLEGYQEGFAVSQAKLLEYLCRVVGGKSLCLVISWDLHICIIIIQAAIYIGFSVIISLVLILAGMP